MALLVEEKTRGQTELREIKQNLFLAPNVPWMNAASLFQFSDNRPNSGFISSGQDRKAANDSQEHWNNSFIFQLTLARQYKPVQ